MKSDLKERPFNPETESNLPGDIVAVQVMLRITRDGNTPITEAEHSALEASGAWERIFTFGDFDGMFAEEVYEEYLADWREAFPAFPTRSPRTSGRRTLHYTVLILSMYCRRADTASAYSLLRRKWKIGGVTLTPTTDGACKPLAWVSREDPLEDPSDVNAVPHDRIAKLTTLADMLGGNVTLLAKVAGSAPPQNAPAFLVEGLIPQGNVTLLAAERKVGKSTLLNELCVTVAQGGGHWCGFTVPKAACNGFAVYLPGEDTHEVYARTAAMDPDGRMEGRLLVLERDSRPLPDRLAELDGCRVSLLVVDPARAFLVGDEDSSDAGNVFFRHIEEFAVKHGAAAIVTQHLKKDASPRNVNEIPAAIRGTGVFLDRPRVVLGMVRSADATTIGIPAPNGNPLHNFRASIMFAGQRRLTRDEATMCHIPVEQGGAADRATMDKVLAAVRRLNSEGNQVTRTGRRGIFELRPDEIDGLSRQKIRAATDALIDAGELVDGGAGDLVVPVTV